MIAPTFVVFDYSEPGEVSSDSCTPHQRQRHHHQHLDGHRNHPGLLPGPEAGLCSGMYSVLHKI